jgi:hypothetical protein
MTSMTMNFRPVSFAILSGALMLVGSSMAFANPDQTNPRESTAPTTATVSQDTSVSADSSSSTAASNPFITESQHDARKDRNRNGNEK